MSQIENDNCDSTLSNNDVCEKKIIDRIKWVTHSLEGMNILDIGCLLGTTSLFLAKEGKTVIGIDDTPAIDVAINNLKKEKAQNLVTFKKGNFMFTDFSTRFDGIVLNEELSLTSITESLFEKVVSLLNVNGQLFIFSCIEEGNFKSQINYFLNLQSEKITLKKVEFFENSIGVLYINNINKNNELEKVLSRKKGLFVDNHTKQSNGLDSSLKENMMHNNKIKEFKADINDLENKEKNYKSLYLEEKVEKINIQNELLNQYKREEELLSIQTKLNIQTENLLDRYNSLKNSTLGKLTTKYWRWRNKRGKKNELK